MASRKLFVGSLPHNCDEGIIRSEFSKHGPIESVFVKKNCEPGRQWAFVTYATPEQAQNAKQLTDRILTFPGAEKACDVTVARNQGMFGQDPLVPKPVDPMAALGALGMGIPGMAMPMGGEQPRKIFVGSLPDSVTDAILRAEFSKFGGIIDLFLKTGCEPGRQWAFITYQTPEQANYAKSSADRVLVVPGADRPCEVMIAKNQGKNGNEPMEAAANASAALFAQNPLAAYGAFGAQMPFAMPMPAVQWQTYFTTAGQPYYHNASTGVTQWECPPELQAQQFAGALPAPGQQFMGQYAQPAAVAYGAPQYAQYAQPAAVAYGAPQQAAQLPAIGNNQGAIGYAGAPQQAAVAQAAPIGYEAAASHPAVASAQPVGTPIGYEPGAPGAQPVAAAQPAPVAYAQLAAHPAAQPAGVAYGAAMPPAPVDPSRVAPY